MGMPPLSQCSPGHHAVRFRDEYFGGRSHTLVLRVPGPVSIFFCMILIFQLTSSLRR